MVSIGRYEPEGYDPEHPRCITPWTFAEVLEAAGVVQDRNRISEIVIRAKPNQVVTIEVKYLADERLFHLAELAKERRAEGCFLCGATNTVLGLRDGNAVCTDAGACGERAGRKAALPDNR